KLLAPSGRELAFVQFQFGRSLSDLAQSRRVGMGPQGHGVEETHDGHRLARVPGKAPDAHPRMEDARWISCGANDLIMIGTAESEVADYLRRDRQVGQRLALGAENRDASLAGFRTMEVGDPQVSGRIERAAIAAGAAQVKEDFGPAQALV